MALKTGLDNLTARFILINDKQSIGKQHFTICHELYHLFIQKDFVSRVCKTGLFDKKDKEEYNADIFASYLLLPTDGLIELIPDEELAGKHKISIGTIVYLEQFFSCSRRALLYRLKKMKLISDVQYEQYCMHVKRSALENGFNIDLYEAGNHNVIIGNYGSVAKELFDKDRISESHYYSLLSDLGININAFENESNGDE